MTSITPTRYDPTTIALHWATALLVVALWVIGQTADWFPDHGLANTTLWSTHVALGFVLAAILVWRMAWRSGAGRRLPPADAGPLRLVAKATHHGLYLLLVGVAALGIANAVVRGYSFYGLFHLPQVGDRAWRRPLTQWHGFAANVTLALAGIHAAAAFIHHYILRDRLIDRMLFKRCPASIDPPMQT